MVIVAQAQKRDLHSRVAVILAEYMLRILKGERPVYVEDQKFAVDRVCIAD